MLSCGSKTCTGADVEKKNSTKAELQRLTMTTLWETIIAMETQNLKRQINYKWAMFHSHVSLPESNLWLCMKMRYPSSSGFGLTHGSMPLHRSVM